MSAATAARGLALLGLVLTPAAGATDEATVGDAVPEAACALSAASVGTVGDVVDGDTLVLDDGSTVRMAGIEAPKAENVRSGGDVAALAAAARRELERLAGGARIALRFGEHRRDRHDRALAQLYLEDGSWLQESMVSAGLARVRPFAGDFSCLDGLLEREGEAREARRGIWRSSEFAAVAADDPSLIERKGLYVLVEGRIVSVGRGNRVDFLNFGHYWRRDFTVMVGASVRERMEAGGRPVETLTGRRVRVRGVIEESGGPAIRLNDPGEIEVVDDD